MIRLFHFAGLFRPNDWACYLWSLLGRESNVIPLYDKPREARTLIPFINYLLVALNVAVFLFMQLSLDENGWTVAVYTFGVIPVRITGGQNPFPVGIEPAWLSLFTSMFLHGGWLHLIGNMLFLWVFGDNVESAMGHAKYLLFYLITGIGASGLNILIDPTSVIPAIGASGAIAGVLAAYVLFYPNAGVKTLIFIVPFITVTTISAIILIGIWFVLQLINGFIGLGSQAGGVAYFAHVGGFVVGFLLANAFRKRNTPGFAS